jgi:ubiquinone/menaquinone biosynthesis C-methylase UbiE
MHASLRILVSMIREKQPRILDAGCGTGIPASLIGKITPSADLYLLDNSSAMIAESRKSWPNSLRLPVWVRGNALSMPLKGGQFDAVLACHMIKFISDRVAFFKEVTRLLKPRGILFIVTYDPQDLHSQLFHKYFPSYLRLDLQCHPKISQLYRELGETSFQVQETRKVPYRYYFRTRKQLLSFVSTRPFSTFMNYSQRQFDEAFVQFRRRVEIELPEKHILNECRQTCISAYSQD